MKVAGSVQKWIIAINIIIKNTIKSVLKASSALYGKGKHGQTISAVFCQMKVHIYTDSVCCL